ncbi:inhibitor of nuclear factor kappa-B kinase subunit beta-like isoform X2 [Rhodnius prolixus]|uniref:inhibitor of nuclear factor kappa-B kinase subunit beta-like isoform X2 n=1 Tax=Rhodnius prolixus TaxID=13249 RepID=UPI003D18D5D8
MGTKKQTVGLWCKESVLGKGGFGVVTQWKNMNTGEMIALKLIRTGEGKNQKRFREKLLKEVDDIKKLSHTNLVKILPLPDEMCEKLSDNVVLICMEYCKGGDLRKILNQPKNCCGLTERIIRQLLRDIKNGVHYLHKMGIIHGDIKPENIVLQEINNEVVYKLIDLGHRKELDQNKLYSSYVGTLQYLAPEILSQTNSFSVDYWSLGVVCHEIITGFRPFPSDIPPLRWASLIKSKDYEDICISKNIDGVMEFNKHLPSEVHISQFLKDEFEYWLRLSLEWNGKIRGRNINNEILIFSALDSILNKKIITIFSTVTLKQLSYEIDYSTAITTLKGWIQRDTKHFIDDQLILLPSGETLLDESMACTCWDPTNEVAMAYVFSKSDLKLPSVYPEIPSMVKTIIEEPKRLHEYKVIKKIWSHAVYFIQNQLRLYSTFLEALAVKLLSILKNIEVLTSSDTVITNEIQQAIGKMKLCTDSMNFNQEYLKKIGALNGKINITSDWRKRSKVLHEQLSQIYAIAKTLSSKITVAKFNFEKAQTIHERALDHEDQLQKILEASYKLYKSLQTMPKELRESESNSFEMVALVVKTLEARDNLLKNRIFCTNLKFICESESEIINLKHPLEEFYSSVKELSNDIAKFHCATLQDTWEATTCRV